MRQRLTWTAILTGALFAAGELAAPAASTPGTLTFKVTTYRPAAYSYGTSYDVAFWIQDRGTNFVKTLKRNGTGDQSDIKTWYAVPPNHNMTDATSGSTLTAGTTHTLTWTGTNVAATKILVTDGVYRICMETTAKSAQGPLATNLVFFTKGTASANTTFSNFSDGTVNVFSNMSLTWTPIVDHNIAVTKITTPATIVQGDTNTIPVIVSNLTTTAETNIPIVLSNMTSSAVMATNLIASLGANATLTNNFQWIATNALATYALRAQCGPVTGETNLTDNSLAATSVVRAVVHDVAVSAVSAPAAITIGQTTNVTVTVTNIGDRTETFAVALTDRTDAVAMTTWPSVALAAAGGTNLVYSWNTTGRSAASHTLAGIAGIVAGETATANNTNTTAVTLSSLAHNIGITSLSVPLIVNPGTTSTIPVVVSNKTTTAESFTVSLSNLTAAALIGTTNLTSMTGNTALTVNFKFAVTNLADGAYTLRAQAGPVAGESDTSDNTASATTAVHMLVHDLALTAITAAAEMVKGTTYPLGLTVLNQGDFAESYSAAITDRTAGVTLASWSGTVGAGAQTNLSGSWNTTGAALGAHALAGLLAAVAGETDLADNTNTTGVTIWLGALTNNLVARGGVWKYNDQGLDLHPGPWNNTNYYDGTWKSGPGPFGYGLAVATTNAFGSDPNHKHPCTYYRREVVADAVPTNLTLRLLKNDGAVVYINGVEAVRTNLADGATAYADLATATVSPANSLTYVDYAVDPNLLRPGRNVLAAEVHQAAPNSADLSFDLELTQAVLNSPLVPDAAVIGVTAPPSAQTGDRVNVGVHVANPGPAAVSFTVTLTDTNTAVTIGSQQVSGLVPGETRDLSFAWNAPVTNAAVGAHTLQAAASSVTGGSQAETNTANNSVLAAMSISGTGFGLAPVNAIGSIGGFCAAVAVSGTNLYVGEGATLSVYSLATPTAPALVNRLRLQGNIENVAVGAADGTTRIYVAAGAAGVHFVDGTDPVNPVLRATLDTSGHAHGVAVSGNTLYVADGIGGLRIVNAQNLAAPSLVGAYATVGPARDVVVNGGTAYLLDQHDGLLVLDVSSASPALLGSCPLIAAGEALASVSGYLCAVDGEGKLSTINVGTPAAPSLGAQVLAAGAGRAVAVNGSSAYVACGAAGVQMFNVAAPAAPVAQGTAVVPGEASGVATYGGYVYVAAGYGGVRILSGASLAEVGALDAGLRARDVAVGTNLVAYVAAGENGVAVYSMTNWARPVKIGALAGAGNARAVAVAGHRLYVADGQYGLRIADISTPASPTLLGTWSNAIGPVRAVAGSATRVLITDGRILQLLDVSNPASPSLAGTYDAAQTNSQCYVYDVSMAGGCALAAAGQAGLMTFSLSNLGRLGGLDTGGNAVGVSGTTNTAYVADSANGWLAVDVSTPASPLQIGTVHVGQGAVYGLAADGSMLQVVDGAGNAHAVDVTVPLAPADVLAFAPLSGAFRVGALAGLAFTAEDAAGLAVLAAVANDINRNGLPDAFDQQIVDANAGDEIRTIFDVRPGDDFDRDSASNAQELQAGTNPTDANSVFKLGAPSGRPGGTGFFVRWNSVLGKNYTVYRSTNLVTGLAGFLPLANGIPGNGTVNIYTDNVSVVRGYYIIGVEP